MSTEMTSQTFKVFKVAYKVVRENAKEIYKGFGFQHLSDVTQYYVHPDNQSFRGTTTLCQPIGEALILFTTMLREGAAGNRIGDYYVSTDHKTVFLRLHVPVDYRDNGVVEPLIHTYAAVLENNCIRICAYDENDLAVRGFMEHLHPLYKLLPVFMVLLAREMEMQPDFRRMMETFVENPVADLFVNLHEDFYQAHKTEDYTVFYEDILPFDTSDYTACSSQYKVIQENKRQVK